MYVNEWLKRHGLKKGMSCGQYDKYHGVKTYFKCLYSLVIDMIEKNWQIHFLFLHSYIQKEKIATISFKLRAKEICFDRE